MTKELGFIDQFGVSAILNGHSIGAEVLPFLDTTFKKPVTEGIYNILAERPKKPISFLASFLKSYIPVQVGCETTVRLSDEISFSLRPALKRLSSGSLRRFSSLPVLLVHCPSEKALLKAVQELTRTPSDVERYLIMVELPTQDKEQLIYYDGKPYLSDLSHVLQKQDPDSCELFAQCSRSHPHMSLNVFCQHVITHLLGDIHTVLPFSSILEKISKESPVEIVQLPDVSINPVEHITTIHNSILKFKDIADVPPILFVSFNSDVELLTLSRIMISYKILQDKKIRQDIQKLRKNYMQERLKYTYENNIRYWEDVIKSRASRDCVHQKYGIKKLISESSGNGGREKTFATEDSQVDISLKNTKLHRLIGTNIRSKRRLQEDYLFQQMKESTEHQSATRIQSIWRRYRIRVLFSDRVSGSPPKVPCDSYFFSPHLTNSIPIIVCVVLRYLQLMYSSLFVSEVPSIMPQQRTNLRFWKPRRQHIFASSPDDISSDEESWELTNLILPSSRIEVPPSKMDLLACLIKYDNLSGFEGLKRIRMIQDQFRGASKVQRRVYFLQYSLSLNLIYIAFAELSIRNLLPPSMTSFSDYFFSLHTYLFDLMASFHSTALLTRAICDISRNKLRDGYQYAVREDRLLLPNDLPVMICLPDDDMSLWLQDSLQQSLHTVYHRLYCTRRTPMIYTTPAFLPAFQWKQVLHHLYHNENCRYVMWICISSHPATYINGLPFLSVPRPEERPVEGMPSYYSLTPLEVITSSDSTTKTLESKPKPPPSPPLSFDIGLATAPAMSFPLLPIFNQPAIASDKTHATSIMVTSANFDITMEWMDHALGELIKSDILDMGESSIPFYTTNPILENFSLESSFPTLLSSTSGETDDTARFSSSAEDKFSTPLGSSILMLNQHHSFYRKQLLLSSSKTSTSLAHSSSILSPKTSAEIPFSEGGNISQEKISLPTQSSTVTNSFRSANETTNSFHIQFSTPSNQFMMLKEAVPSDFQSEYYRVCGYCSNGADWQETINGVLQMCYHTILRFGVLVFGLDQPQELFYPTMAGLLVNSIVYDCVVGSAPSTLQITNKPTHISSLTSTISLLSSTTSLNTIEKDESGNEGSCFEFLKEFWGLLHDMTSLQDVEKARLAVESILYLSFGRNPILKRVESDIQMAKQHRGDSITCRSHIQSAAFFTEQYCWLILVALFLESPEVHQSIRDKSPTMPTFSSFIQKKNLKLVVQWMNKIDPWLFKGMLTPDPAHLSYSSYFSRWMNKNQFITYAF